MVQVQSSWFPLYDRNPQTFVPNIFLASPGDYRKATQRIYHAPGQASFVELPVVTARIGRGGDERSSVEGTALEPLSWCRAALHLAVGAARAEVQRARGLRVDSSCRRTAGRRGRPRVVRVVVGADATAR